MRVGERVVFREGFAKNERADLAPDELRALRRLAELLLGLGDAAIEAAVRAGRLLEL